MENIGKPRGLVPLEESKDCSRGICTMFCPQWCYILFPPPPPSFSLSDDDNDRSDTAFSPLIIGIIGILGAAFLLISYYTVATKYRNASFFSRRRPPDDRQEEESLEQSQRLESWHLSSANGLDEALIAKITVCLYRTGEGIVDGTDCSVCLAEFKDGESLRLLPKCRHAFHLQCIDTWLKSQSSCPLCRVSIVVRSDLESRVASALSHERERAVAVVEDFDLERNGGGEEDDDDEEGSEAGNERNGCKDFRVVEIREEDDLRSVSMSSMSQDEIFSIADVLRESGGSEADGGSRRHDGGDNREGRRERSRGLHFVMSPVRMKRSVSSGKSCFMRKGRGVRFFCCEEERRKSDGEGASLGTSSK